MAVGVQRLVGHTLAFVGVLLVVGWIITPPPPAAGGEAAEHGRLMLNGKAKPADDGFSGDETIIERGRTGQFHLQARINGQETEFLVDTGADVVALTVADAERLGIEVAREDFRPIIKTASGVGKAAVVRIDRLELGEDEFTDIDAMVAEGLEVNLLGQSVLRRLGKVELRGDRMVIEHR